MAEESDRVAEISLAWLYFGRLKQSFPQGVLQSGPLGFVEDSFILGIVAVEEKEMRLAFVSELGRALKWVRGRSHDITNFCRQRLQRID